MGRCGSYTQWHHGDGAIAGFGVAWAQRKRPGRGVELAPWRRRSDSVVVMAETRAETKRLQLKGMKSGGPVVAGASHRPPRLLIPTVTLQVGSRQPRAAPPFARSRDFPAHRRCHRRPRGRGS